jgi:hypothetical protein
MKKPASKKTPPKTEKIPPPVKPEGWWCADEDQDRHPLYGYLSYLRGLAKKAESK